MKKITLSIFLVMITFHAFGQNNSLNFDGADDYVELGQNFAFTPTDAFTIEAWIKIDAVGLKQIISKLGVEQNTFRGWGFQINSAGNLSGYISSEWDVHSRFVEGTIVFGDNLWHHVAMTFDGADTILLYIDGQEETISVENIDGTLTTIETTSNTHIGNYDGNGNPGEYFRGNMDELRVWTGVRTPTEIADNYLTELGGTETNLIGYYKMDIPNSSCDVQDCNANEAHGERNGFNGANDSPQFSDDTPSLTDIACGATIDCVLGAEDSPFLSLILSPNPTEGLIGIAGVEIIGTTVEIHNALGSVVGSALVSNKTIDISSLPAGLYFITLKVDTNKVTRKIIKK